MGSSMTVEAVVERYLRDVLERADPRAPADVISNEALTRKVAAFRRAFGELEISPHVIVGAGEYAAVHFSARGTHRGTFQGVPATGRRWTAGCSAVFRVRDGRITDFWMTWDMLAILEQVGAVSRPPDASA